MFTGELAIDVHRSAPAQGLELTGMYMDISDPKQITGLATAELGNKKIYNYNSISFIKPA